MARGWESKSVEEQQSQAMSSSNASHRNLSPEQKRIKNVRDGLMLSKKRVQQQLADAKNPRHRLMLEAALAEIENKLAQPELP